MRRLSNRRIVELASGTFVTAPLTLRSNVTLQIDSGATLLPGSPDMADWTNAVMMTASTDNGKSFSPPVDISTQMEKIGSYLTEVHAFKPAIAVGKNGAIFVSFQRYNVTGDLVPGFLVTLRLDMVVIRSTEGGATLSNAVVP